MSLKSLFVVFCLCWPLLAACSSTGPAQLPTSNPVAAVTAAPTLPAAAATPVRVAATCADIDATWGKDWPALLEALEELIAAGQDCGDEPLASKKYAAHFNYGATLEDKGSLEPAIAQYRAALFIDPQRKEALDALVRLQALPKATPPACLSTSPPRPDPAPAEAPDPTQFVTVSGAELQLDGRPFTVKGANYYPRRAPWQRFLKEADQAEMAEELDAIAGAGFNTIRVFLWYEPLFTCQPEDAIPQEAAFATVDALFRLARERNLKVIIALNDLPDLVFRPLYTDWPHYDARTIYIVRRYRNEPALLAWDLRNEVDVDYGAQPGQEGHFSQEEVLAWVAHISELIRENDPHHLLTAGWWGDPTVAAPYLDILSFHYWTGAGELQNRIEQYMQASDKPLMLQEVGYSSWAETADSRQAEKEQADQLAQVIGVAERRKISGWLVWTAFDFVPEPGQPVINEHFFGLWRIDLSPKPALEALPLQP